MWQIRPRLLAVALAGLLVGCGGDRLHRVFGTVTWKGKPIPAGLLFFDPDESKGTEGIQGFASIKDGKFDTALEGRGVTGGSYLIRILGFDGKTGNEAPLGNALFREYQVTRELPRADTELTLDVPAGKP